MKLLILFPVTCIVCATCLLIHGSDGGIPLIIAGVATFAAIDKAQKDHET